MATVETKHQYLERDSKSSYKQLAIKGRRIRALTLYSAYAREEDPQTIEEIAADYDLPLEAVKEAIAYCESDPPEIRRDLALDQALMEASGMNDPKYKYHGKPKVLSPETLARIYAEHE